MAFAKTNAGEAGPRNCGTLNGSKIELVPADVKQRSHDHAGGKPFLDLDELVHAIVAIWATMRKAVASGMDDVYASWMEEGKQTATDLGGMLRETQTLSVGLVAGSGLTMLGAYFAISGGTNEWKEAREALSMLKRDEATLRERIEQTAKWQSSDDFPAQVRAELLDGDRQRYAELAERKNQLEAQSAIGVVTTASGSMMLVKACTDLVFAVGVKVAGLVGLSIGNGVGIAATVLGAVGNLVVSPVAALMAMTMGSVFVHRSRIAYRELVAVVAGWQSHLVPTPYKNSPIHGEWDNYVAFLENKAPKRTSFLFRYRNWNIGFLTGTTIFTASVLAKTGLAIAGVAGGLLLLNPAGLAVATGVLVLVMAVGAIGMGIGSYNFLFKHATNKRYESFQRNEHPQLDRALGETLDLRLRPPGTREICRREKGFAYRAKVYDAMLEQEHALQMSLQYIAERPEVGKFYAWTTRSGLKQKGHATEAPRAGAYREHRKVGVPSWQKDVKALGAALRRFVSKIGKGQGSEEARRRARSTYDRKCASLTATDVAPFLKKTLASNDVYFGVAANFSEQSEDKFARATIIGTLRALLTAQSSLLEKRIAARQDLRVPTELEGVDEAWRKAGQKNQSRDEKTLGKIAESLGRIPGDTGSVLTTWIADFLRLQERLGMADEHDAESDNYVSLAKFMVEDAPKRLARLRGELFDAEVESMRRAARMEKKDRWYRSGT